MNLTVFLKLWVFFLKSCVLLCLLIIASGFVPAGITIAA